MFTAKIKEVKRDVYQASQTPFLDVEVEILDEEGEVVETRKYAYNADTPEDVIVADIEKMLETYKSDLEIGEQSKTTMELNAKADATAESLKGVEIAPSEPKAKGKK